MSSKAVPAAAGQSSNDLLHRTVDMIATIAAALIEGQRAKLAYNAHVAEGFEPATAAAKAVLLGRK